MTDKKTCVLYIAAGSWRVALVGADELIIEPNDKGWKLLFAPDEQHFIRPGAGPALALVNVPKRNALTLANRTDTAAVVGALLAGEEVKARFITFPDRKALETSVHNPSVAYAYQDRPGQFMHACRKDTLICLSYDLPPFAVRIPSGFSKQFVESLAFDRLQVVEMRLGLLLEVHVVAVPEVRLMRAFDGPPRRAHLHMPGVHQN